MRKLIILILVAFLTFSLLSCRTPSHNKTNKATHNPCAEVQPVIVISEDKG